MPFMGGLGDGMLYWWSFLTGQVGGLPVGIRCRLASLGVVYAAETLIVLYIGAGVGAGH